MAKEDTSKHLDTIDGAAAVQKGVSQLRESQQSTKPEGVSRPQGVIVPPVPTQTQASNEAPVANISETKK